jgi:hypothetical protein
MKLILLWHKAAVIGSETNNREFFKFSGEKQASDGALATFPWKFNHCPSGLGAVPGCFLLFVKQAIEARKQAI